MLSLVAHAIGYKMIVGAHNTVNVRRMWEVLPCCTKFDKCQPHNTVDAQMHVGGLTALAWYGN